jgi:hypothetical protein
LSIPFAAFFPPLTVLSAGTIQHITSDGDQPATVERRLAR